MARPSPAREADLRDNLKQLSKRLPKRAFNPLFDQPPLDDLVPLYDIVATIEPDLWPRDKATALLQVLELAIMQIEESAIENGQLTWREAALTLFDFTGLLPDMLEKNAYNRLTNEVYERADLQGRARNKAIDLLTGGVRVRLARVLLEMERAALEPPVSEDPDRQSGVKVVHQLPTNVEHFIGRQSQLALLDETQQASGAGSSRLRLAAITGPPGVGKTGLALQWAHKHRDGFESELYIDLRGYSPEEEAVSTADALARFLRVLGDEGQPLVDDIDERAAQYRTLLDGRKVLVVLDNAVDSEHVRQLLPGRGPSTVLVTSRDDLTGLRVQHDAQWVEVQPMPISEADDLLRVLVGDQADEESSAVRDIARVSGRLPLSLRLIAGAIINRQGTSLRDVYIELADESRRLDLLDAGGDPRLDVRAVFSWSYRSLDAELASSLALLSLVPGVDIDTSATAALLHTDTRTAARHLDRLKRANLLEELEPGRFDLHDLISLYAREKAREQLTLDLRQSGLSQLQDYYLATIAKAMDVVHPHETHLRPAAPSSPIDLPLNTLEAARAWLDLERMNLVAAGLANPEDVYRTELFGSILYRELEMTGHYDEAIALNEAAAAGLGDTGEPVARAEVRLRLGLLSWRSGHKDSAIRLLTEAIGILEPLERSDRTMRATLAARGNLSVVHANSGDLPRGIELARQVVEDSRRAGNRLSEAYSLTNLGAYLSQAGAHEEGLLCLEQALPIHRDCENPQGEAIALSNMAESLEELGRRDEVKPLFEEALAIYEDRGDANGAGRSLNNLAIYLKDDGELEPALQLAEKAEEIQHELRDAKMEIESLINQAEILARLGRHDDAAARIEAAEAIRPRVDDGWVDAQIRHSAAITLIHVGDAEGARAALEQAANLASAVDDSEQGLKSLELLGDLYMRDADPVGARAAWEKALGLVRSTKSIRIDRLNQKIADIEV